MNEFGSGSKTFQATHQGLVAPSDRNSEYSESDPEIPDILAGILYRSEGENEQNGLPARTIYVVESY